MTMAEQVDPFDIVATGTLFKLNPDKESWSERNVTLCGEYLYQYSKENDFRGKFPIVDSIIDVSDVTQKNLPTGYFPFIIKNNSKSVTFCASSKDEWLLWISTITNQVRRKTHLLSYTSSNPPFSSSVFCALYCLILFYLILSCPTLSYTVLSYPNLYRILPYNMTRNAMA